MLSKPSPKPGGIAESGSNVRTDTGEVTALYCSSLINVVSLRVPVAMNVSKQRCKVLTSPSGSSLFF